MDEIRFMAAGGSLGGSGVYADCIAEALTHKPHFIANDGGSTDSGPYFLGSGKSAVSWETLKHDMALVVKAGLGQSIPVIVGSAATAGGDIHVDWTIEILKQILREEGLKARIAIIHAEQDKTYLKQALAQGRISPLNPAPQFDADTIDRSIRIVGMMGVEPLQDAVRSGAEIVIAGRASDAALFAALPIAKGFPAGLAWHAGKILECGTLACEKRGRGVIFARVTRDDLVITPVGDNLRCTPQSVAAHGLYENSDPFLHKECSGTLDLSASTYHQLDDGRSIRIAGSRFHEAETYTVKLEGAELAGYQCVIVCGIRDPYIIEALDSFLEGGLQSVRHRVKTVFGNRIGEGEYTITFHAYGRDGILGKLEPRRDHPSHEIGLVIEVTAQSEELAEEIAHIARKLFLHHPIPKWKGGITGIALLHSPAVLKRGPVYRFCVNHVLAPAHPLEMFRISMADF